MKNRKLGYAIQLAFFAREHPWIPEGNKLSAAMERFEAPNTDHELYTRFRYSPLEGLGFDPDVGRRDPSSIIKVDDTYFVWYTHCTDPIKQWINADLYYATSKDGYKWEEQGPAVERGPDGSWDDLSVYTCNILVAEGKYYLVYQAETKEYSGMDINVVGMAWADSPHGPWTKLPDPILKPAQDAVLEGNLKNGRKEVKVTREGSFDSKNCHDPGIVKFNGKYYLYYKGHGWIMSDVTWGATHPADTKWGVAIADKPEGPYLKSEYNPIMNSGHEVWVFPWKTGIAALVDFAGPEAHTAQYSEDGINFYPMCALEDLPPAGGAYIPDKFADNKDGRGFSWGLCHVGGRAVPKNFLIRFDCDLERGKPKNVQWNQYRFYSTVRDVLYDPEQYGIPQELMEKQRELFRRMK
jgi:hypothetical protein